MLYALHDALVKRMRAGLYTPGLAESFTPSKDGLTYEPVIRKGAKFHNGDPVTAAAGVPGPPATRAETRYIDSCCHVNTRGDEILAEILDAMRGDLRPGARR